MSVFTRSRKTTVLGGLALVGASALVLAGCAGGGTGGTEEPTENAGPTEELSLTLGTALPQTGNLAFLGPPEEAGVAYAMAQINEVTADTGLDVDVVFGDSGDTDNKAYEAEIPRLLGEGVSAIIGAASSGVSLQFIDQVTGAGVIQFSPANTSADFTEYNDNDLYWRTAPSDVLQGEVLGNLIAEDGNATLGMIVLNDSYGTGLAQFTKDAFEAAGGEVVAEALFNEGDSSFDAQISEVTAANPDAIAVITFDQAKIITPALVGSGYPGDQLYFVDGNLADYTADFAPGLVAGSKGTLPGLDVSTLGDFTDRLLEVDPNLQDYSYAAESYDAVVLVALAAYAANSTDGVEMAKYLRQVSGGSGDGEKVSTYEEGVALLDEGKQIDYDGPSGPITFDEHGDPTEATIGIYEYNDDNTYSRIGDG